MGNIGEKLDERYISLEKRYDNVHKGYYYKYDFTGTNWYGNGFCYGGFNMFLQAVQDLYKNLNDPTINLLIKEKDGAKFEEEEIKAIKNAINEQLR